MDSKSGDIFTAIPKVMEEIGAIGKDQENQAQGFKYRGIDDVYNHLQPILTKHGIFTVPKVLSETHEERQTKRGGVLIYRIFKIQYTFYAKDGSYIQAVVVGEGMDSGDKAGNKAMSIGHKYALIQVFAIPTSDPKDPDGDSPGQDGIKGKKGTKRNTKKQPENLIDTAEMADSQKDELFKLMKSYSLTEKPECKAFFDHVLGEQKKTVAWAKKFIEMFWPEFIGWLMSQMSTVAFSECLGHHGATTIEEVSNREEVAKDLLTYIHNQAKE